MDSDFDIKHYLVLSERKNSLDSLERSLEFLQKVDSQNNYWKWFILAFHHSLHSLIIIVLPYKDRWVKGSPLTLEEIEEMKLKGFMTAYSTLLRNKMSDNKDLAETLCDSRLNAEYLNNKLRNVLQHFKDGVWSYDRSIIAEVCLPLVEVQTKLWELTGNEVELIQVRKILSDLKGKLKNYL